MIAYVLSNTMKEILNKPYIDGKRGKCITKIDTTSGMWCICGEKSDSGSSCGSALGPPPNHDHIDCSTHEFDYIKQYSHGRGLQINSILPMTLQGISILRKRTSNNTAVDED